MIWRLAICFSIPLVLPMAAAVVTGTVDLQPPKAKGAANRDASGVAVWLDPSRDVPVRVAAQTVKMIQKEKTFIPHVLAVHVNSSVDFPNFDPIFHNAFSNFNGQIFDVGLYPPGSTRIVKFRRPGIVRVFCNIHPTMSAVIVVLKTPYFDVTDSSGSFRIGDVPPGEYTLSVFHERATQSTLEGLQRKIHVAADMALPPINVSETGYLPMPHKNKYGKDYPAVIHDTVGYPGAEKK
jgi:plastocyanin